MISAKGAGRRGRQRQRVSAHMRPDTVKEQGDDDWDREQYQGKRRDQVQSSTTVAAVFWIALATVLVAIAAKPLVRYIQSIGVF